MPSLSWENYEEVIPKLNAAPFYKNLSITLISVDEGGSVLKINLDKKHSNLWGNVHGGAIASLVDITNGLSVIPYIEDGEIMVAVDLHVHFLAPAILDGYLLGKGRVIGGGRKLITTEAEITDKEGRQVAKGTSVIRILKVRGGNE